MADLLSGQVKTPVGTFPKPAVVLGVGGVIGLIIWERHKQSKQAAASPAAAGTGQYPPDGTTGDPSDPYSTDPATGQTYGDEATAGGGGGTLDSGLQTAGDAYPWDGTYNNTSDPYSMDSSTGQTYGNEGFSGSVSSFGGNGQAGPPFSTNSQWSQYVLDYFSTNQYSDLAGRTDAIGLYINGRPVNQVQALYIQDAIAIGGSPPVAGAGNFPPSIRATGSQGGTVTIPDLKGKTAGAAHNTLVSDGLVPIADPGQHSADIVTGTNPAAGRKVQKGTHVVIAAKAGKPGEVTVPDEAGKTAGTAHDDLVHAGLKPAAAAGQKAGQRVTRTSPAAGTKVKRGSRVTIETR